MKSGKKIAAIEICALVFGVFLGLCILKFGDPVILDQKISAPTSLSEFWSDSWPTHWANWLFFPLAMAVAVVGWCSGAMRAGSGKKSSAASPAVSSSIRKDQNRGRASSADSEVSGLEDSRQGSIRRRKWLFVLPLLWLGWQFVSSTWTVDPNLTGTTLWQFCGCVACYFLGALIFNTPRRFQFLLAGILAAFAICLVCAVRQWIEFPTDTKFLVEGQRSGWTNLPPQTVLEMKRDQTIITTNGMDIVNPAILQRFAKRRVMGTMVYPNALAQIILLLFPLSLVLALQGAQKLRPVVRYAAVTMSVALAIAAFFWSGSKFGWLIAIGIGGLYLLRLRWSLKLKVAALVAVAVLGIGAFAIRFHHYFATGATSAVARFDYWKAAVQTTASRPVFGTGAGTFQRPYAQLKSPAAEMARLAHNDYLEQFSDSGMPGGLLYCSWMAIALTVIGKRAWTSPGLARFVLFLGILGWAIQEVGEFALYIPGSAWIAFLFLGYLVYSYGCSDELECINDSSAAKFRLSDAK